MRTKLQCNLNAKQSISQSSLLICRKRVTKKDLISCAYNHKFLIIFLELLLQLALNLLHILEPAACNELNFHFSEISGRKETEFLLLRACRQVTSTLLCHFTTDGFTVQQATGSSLPSSATLGWGCTRKVRAFPSNPVSSQHFSSQQTLADAISVKFIISVQSL